jgi:hypothetical protein
MKKCAESLQAGYVKGIINDTYDPSIEFGKRFGYDTLGLVKGYKLYLSAISGIVDETPDKKVIHEEFQEFLKDVLDGKYEGDFSDVFVFDDAIVDLAERKYGEEADRD